MVGDQEGELSAEDLKRLEQLDSTLFGFVHLQDSLRERIVVYKGVKCLERKLQDITFKQTTSGIKEDSFNDHKDAKAAVDPATQNLLAHIYCKLGHLHLLALDYPKALSAYQRYHNLVTSEAWKDTAALYGLGLVYYHFNAFQWAAELFRQVLYTEPLFVRANEVHLRLGLIFKYQRDWSFAFKHLNLALIDASPCSLAKPEIKFHIAHCYDVQGHFQTAKEKYDEILSSFPTVSSQLKALVYRQLGWLYHRADLFGDRTHRELTAINYLQESTKLDPAAGQTWYYLGRCYSSIVGRAHDAFIAYRHSIDKSESSADTWCSIGVLYQQQNQPMDALQAYICAVQLDRSHWSAWVDLGLLYEQNGQPRDALQCYQSASRNKPDAGVSESLHARIKVLDAQISNCPVLQSKRQNALPTLEEAWKLPIPAELTTRQAQMQQMKIRQCVEGSVLLNMRFPEVHVASRERSTYMTPQQINLMHVLAQSQSQLSAEEMGLLRQLQQQYVVMQQQMKLQQESPSDHLSNGHGQTNVDEDLPQVSQEDLAVYLGCSGDGKHDLTDDILGALGGADAGKMQDVHNDPLLSDAALTSGAFLEPRIQDSSVTSTSHELDMHDGEATGPPPPLNLMAPMGLDLKALSAEVIELCRSVTARKGRVLLPDKCAPPKPPPLPEKTPDKLLIPTPSVTVETKKEAGAPELQEFCYQTPIVVIRGMSAALKLDLGLFSTKSLVENAPDQQLEVRTQLMLQPDENFDQYGNKSWKCESHRSFSTISKYAQYQAQSFQQALKEEQERIRIGSRGQQAVNLDYRYQPFSKRRKSDGQLKQLKFGTNVDLSDEKKWSVQLKEMKKLPSFLKLTGSASNMLSFLGHTVLGMNTLQLYMKVPGCRTPGHQENNSFASVNVNIGPGDCEWFGVPHEYWQVIQKMCEKNGIDYLKGSWWPPLEDLAEARVPVYKFTQKPGDLVWVAPGTVHWVQSLGWCNNIAWNVGPLTARQYQMAVERYEWNKLTSFKSIVPIIHLSWQLCRHVKLTERTLFELLRGVLLRTFCHCQLVIQYLHGLGKELRYHARLQNEVAHYCVNCEVEVWNILFVTEHQHKLVVHCLECARRTDPNLLAFTALNQFTMEELSQWLDNFQLHGKVPGAVA